MSERVGFDPSEGLARVEPYVTFRKTRDGYCWSICATQDASPFVLSALADKAIATDSYIRNRLAELGIDPE